VTGESLFFVTTRFGGLWSSPMLQWPGWIAGITSEEIHLKPREDQRGQQKGTVFKPYEQCSNPMIKAVFRQFRLLGPIDTV